MGEQRKRTSEIRLIKSKTYITFNMKNTLKITLVLSSLCLFYLHKSGDLQAQSELGLRRQIESAFVLLRNESDLIPVQDLEKTEIRILNIGASKIPHFTEMCKNYAVVSQENFTLESFSEMNSKKHKSLKKKELTIIPIIRPASLTPEDKNLIDTLALRENTVICFFAPAEKLNYFKNIHQADGIILAHQSDTLTQNLAAQLLFGGIGAIGRLSIPVNEFFKRGDGLTTQNQFRLKYTIPEEVNWNSQILHQQIDSIGKVVLTEKVAPNCQVLVVKNGKIIFHKAYGFHTYDQKHPAKLTDLYDLASISKVTTALPALMKLHGEGKFNLEATLSDYLPEFKNSNKANLQFRPILAHQARLVPWIPYWQHTFRKGGYQTWQKHRVGDEFPESAFKNKTLSGEKSNNFPTKITDYLYLHKNYKKQIFKYIRKSNLLPKKKYKYSGLSFYLLPTIVEKLTKTDYETYLNENFYHSLGANTLVYNPLRYFPKSQIVPTENDKLFRKQQIHGTVHDEGAIMMGGVSANAGLFGSANDLAKLTQMYLQKGQYAGKTYIAEKSMLEFTSCQYCHEGNRRALGFDKPPITDKNRQNSSVSLDASSESFGHSGFTGTYVWADPKHELILIFLSNRVYPTRKNRKLYQLDIRPTLHQILYDMIKNTTP